MTLAEKLCLSAAFLFFMTGLLTGIWKYWCMAHWFWGRGALIAVWQ